jgi:hypothetical protein
VSYLGVQAEMTTAHAWHSVVLTLLHAVWLVDDGMVAFQTKVKEREEVVLGGAWAKIG